MPRSIRPDTGSSVTPNPKSALAGLREAPQAVIEFFHGTFARDIHTFFPGCRIEREPTETKPGVPSWGAPTGSGFDLGFEIADDIVDPGRSLSAKLFNSRYRLTRQDLGRFTPQDRRLIEAIGSVLQLRSHFILQWAHTSRLELNRGEPGDHYIAACVDPASYSIQSTHPSRVAATILTLRTMALSTYENRRISTGALLLGEGLEVKRSSRYAPSEALRFGVELTGLKSLHRLCDGRRTVFLVDREGKLVDIVDIAQWSGFEDPRTLDRGESASSDDSSVDSLVPCARAYTPHALATRQGGHICLVLSPNQEILVFAAGIQQFAFAHGRWRVLDPGAKFAVWRDAVSDEKLASVLFRTALDLAEGRQGGLLVVVADPASATDRLIAPSDLLPSNPQASEPTPATNLGNQNLESTLGLGLATGPILSPTKKALHYLARGCSAISLDPPVLEALAALDGALVTDSSGALLAFGAILRHDASSLDERWQAQSLAVEGARTTAAIVASRFGPVLKISEDGVVSCFLNGTRAWDL